MHCVILGIAVGDAVSEESDLEKTEDPTPHRIEKAREKGQIPRSRELTSILMLATGLAILLLGGEYLARALAVMIADRKSVV